MSGWDSLTTVAKERQQLLTLRQAETLGDLKPKLIDSARGYYERAKERAFRKCPLPDSRVVHKSYGCRMKAMLAVLILLTGCAVPPVSEAEAKWFKTRCKELGGVTEVTYYDGGRFLGEIHSMRCRGLNKEPGQ